MLLFDFMTTGQQRIDAQLSAIFVAFSWVTTAKVRKYYETGKKKAK
ncbi:hypothetical protein HMPREF6485_2587 [Segatella buccae ATCC 33574]|uniref:Uncharacterized protein n=1 Tax=Segatella buccae ATCC 33574 TaxID=873513 RepID=E6KAF1_9BACT|nr:hypothetical protein HMPREF6485_2587 [Segatella buccae ATCC 33574]